MPKISNEVAGVIRSLMTELGVSAQEVADIAIDLFGHCLDRIYSSKKPLLIDPDVIHQISPAAMSILSLLKHGPKLAAQQQAPLGVTLIFNRDRGRILRTAMGRLAVQTEKDVLENAVKLLVSVLEAKRAGRYAFVYRQRSELHARLPQDTVPASSSPPPSKESSLLN